MHAYGLSPPGCAEQVDAEWGTECAAADSRKAAAGSFPPIAEIQNVRLWPTTRHSAWVWMDVRFAETVLSPGQDRGGRGPKFARGTKNRRL